MYLYPHSNDPNTLGLTVLVFAPAVFLLCWLYNAHRLGKFKKAQPVPKNMVHRDAGKKRLLLICGIGLGILVILVSRLIF